MHIWRLGEGYGIRQVVFCVIFVGQLVWLSIKNKAEGHVFPSEIVLLLGGILSSAAVMCKTEKFQPILYPINLNM